MSLGVSAEHDVDHSWVLGWQARSLTEHHFSSRPQPLEYNAMQVSNYADESKQKPYPLQTCVVSDEKLDEHGKPYVFTHQGQEVKLCCKICLKDFNKDAAKYQRKIADAQKK